MGPRTILCVGDSLTRGGVGWSYVHFSSHRSSMRNAGVDGLTLWGLTRRLARLLRRMPAGSRCVVGIGTNDTELPFQATQPGWRLLMGWHARQMRCVRDDAAFAVRYGVMLDRMVAAGLAPVVLGLPLMEIHAFPEDELARRSELIRALAADRSLPFVDVAGAMRGVAGEPRPVRRFRWSRSPLPRILDAVTMLLCPPSKDTWGRLRGLALTVDGVHWNSASARAVAAAVDRAIEGAGGEAQAG